MSFDISNVVNRGSVRWIVVAVFLFGTIFGATGIAAAQLDGTETEFYDETTAIDNSTTELELTINGTSGSDVFVNYYRIADNGTEVLESEDNILNAPASDQATTTYAVQTENTSAYRVVIHDNGNGLSTNDVGNISVASFSSGGGGGSLLKMEGEYDSIKVVVMFVAVVAVAKVLTGDD